MDKSTRACVAYVAGRSVSGVSGSHIYDYSESRYLTIGGTITGKSVSVFDSGRSCHFSGTLPSLFDYGRSAHVSLKIEGKSFSGFDYGSSQHFSGTVNGNTVTLFDYGVSQHFSFAL